MNEVLKTKKVNLFGHDYDVFFDSCCTNTSKRTLYIELLNICNAKCSFCSSSCNLKITPKILDLNFAKEVIIELLNKNIIDKISITGGEPLIYPYLKDLLDFLDSLLDRGLNFYAITTNGILLEKQINLLEDSKVKYINISRHHYDQEKNDKIFGIKTKTLKELKEIIISSNKEYRLNVTITEEFNTKEDIMKYVEFAKNIGVGNVLIRKEYKIGKNIEIIDQLFSNCLKCKKSTKCECRIKNIDNVCVEYRKVDVNKEQAIEQNREYIRNFVLKYDNKLLGGWSDNSVILYK